VYLTRKLHTTFRGANVQLPIAVTVVSERVATTENARIDLSIEGDLHDGHAQQRMIAGILHRSLNRLVWLYPGIGWTLRSGRRCVETEPWHDMPAVSGTTPHPKARGLR